MVCGHAKRDALRSGQTEASLLVVPGAAVGWGNGQKYGGPKTKAEAGPNGQRFKLGKTFRLNGNGALPRDVLEFATARSRLNHFATFPESLVERLILATTDEGDMILDPFAGTATTGAVAVEHGRRFVGVELNPRYAVLGRKRLKAESVASNGQSGRALASGRRRLHKQRRS